MKEPAKILCVDDEDNVLRALCRLLREDDYEILTATSAKDGLNILLAEGEVQLVISDYRMPGMNGIEFLRSVRSNWPGTVRIVLSGFADTAAVVEAINDGEIYKFVPKPWSDDELRQTIQKAIERYYLKRSNHQLMVELKESNEKLRKVNETLEALVEKALQAAFQEKVGNICRQVLGCLPMGIIGIDPEGDVFHCNDTARGLLGEGEANLLGRPWPAVLPEIFHPFMEKLLCQGVLSEYCQVGGQRGWVKGNKILLEKQEGLLLAFDWEQGNEI